MRIKIENNDLIKVLDFLDGLKAKGKISLARSRMMALLKKKNQEFQDERKQIIEAHAEKDDEGNAIPNEDGTYRLTKKNNILAGLEIVELNSELAVIDYGEYSSRISDLENFLEDFDGELSGESAQGFFVLMDAFENKEDI